jgi:VanZ family protein
MSFHSIVTAHLMSLSESCCHLQAVIVTSPAIVRRKLRDSSVCTCQIMKNLKPYAYWASVILWMCFIFWMSSDSFSSLNTATILEPIVRYVIPSLSGQTFDSIHTIIRKLAHVTEYVILGVLLFQAFRHGKAERGVWQCALYSLLVVALYAASDEFHQSFLSSRTASVVDVAVDVSGGFLAQCINMLLYSRRS